MRAPRSSVWVWRIALLFGGVLLALGIGEVVARFTLPAPALPSPRVARQPEPGMTTFRSLRDLARPNARGIHAGVLHETNDRGIRGPDRSLRPGRGVVRIGVGGDSITMGSGVEEPDTYVARLERMLNSGTSRTRFEVLNFGVSGLNAGGAIERLLNLAAVYHVDVLVYGFTANDIQGPSYVSKISVDEQRARFMRMLHLQQSASYLARAVGPTLAMLLDRLAGSPGSELEEIEYNYFENPAAAADFEAALDRFAEAVRERDGCGLMLMHTKLSQLGWLHPWKRINTHVESLARARGITAIQTHPMHAGRYEPSLWVSPMDPHPNAEGHRILAEALREGLDRLPPHCLVSEASRAARRDPRASR